MTGTVLIDYGAGNLRSVANALQAAGARDLTISDAPELVARATRIILPGVGAFAHCMASLSAIAGMRDALKQAVRARGAPFLGICVGMQLLADVGEEHGEQPGLGWVPGRVRAMAGGADIRIPHMGWNQIKVPDARATLVEDGEAYFLHSYHFCADHPADVAAMSVHGQPIVAAVQRDNILGVQFHPEKSQAYGIALLERFLTWNP
ncbi:MAG: imidazole glycerol phosphate synthase subunit HisH [Sphingomonadaceae bacterium]|nr:imidazole glycerol phosphate synthase subunit HisH [Sphingomonadaceae bacterium]